MHWHTWKRIVTVSFSMAAAGVLVCAVASIQGIIPGSTVLGTLVSMCASAAVMLAVLAGYIWACDKGQDFLDTNLSRPPRGSFKSPSDRSHKEAGVRRNMTVRHTRFTSSTSNCVCRGYVGGLRGIMRATEASNTATIAAKPWCGQ
jgi:hypothetical protein